MERLTPAFQAILWGCLMRLVHSVSSWGGGGGLEQSRWGGWGRYTRPETGLLFQVHRTSLQTSLIQFSISQALGEALLVEVMTKKGAECGA